MTTIEWTDETWNPTRGCSRVSPGCDNCYAMRQARRSDNDGGAYEGLTRIGKRGVDWSGVVRFVPEMLDKPLHWRRPRRVFVNSMSDLFHKSLSNEQIAAVFGVMAACPRHTFQVLTKRPERMREWFEWIASVSAVPKSAGPAPHHDRLALIWKAWTHGAPLGEDWTPHVYYGQWPLPNVWLGVSCEDQPRADERIPHLLATPAAVRFVSAEPLIGPINLRGHMLACARPGDCARCHHGHGFTRCPNTGGVSPQCHHPECACPGFVPANGLHWVIVGGESGPGARPCDVQWIRAIIEQCKVAGAACFVKQLGSNSVRWYNRKGSDIYEWPDGLQVREFPR